MGKISLSWIAGNYSTGYNVYRSTDESTYTKINSKPTTEVAYDDAINSSGDGIIYYYKVTGVGNGESGYSNLTHNIHGTRLEGTYLSGVYTSIEFSPYVVERTATIENGYLSVSPSTKLYVLNNAIIDIEKDQALYVRGLFRTLCSTTEPATITSHHVGAPLAGNEGVYLRFDHCDKYFSSDGSGTLIQNTIINNVSGSTSFYFDNCSPRITNCKVYSNSEYGWSYLLLYGLIGPRIDHCSFNKFVIDVTSSDFRDDNGLKLEYNRFRNGGHCLIFENANQPMINSGQIENNDIDAIYGAEILGVTGESNVPLGNNYWYRGSGDPPTPYVDSAGSTVTFDFSPTLEAAPAGCGPNW